MLHVQGSPGDSVTLEKVLRDAVKAHRLASARVAVAYLSTGGLLMFLKAFGNELKSSKWVVGLDDAVTQPGALDVLSKLSGAELRVASKAQDGARFHPKAYFLQSERASAHDITVVGSANLTASALTRNAEAFAVMQTPLSRRSEQDHAWNLLWEQGHSPTSDELLRYKTEYDEAMRLKRRRNVSARADDSLATPLAPNERLDPTRAQVCWIEGGNITALGRELEFKAEQGLFFGLNPTGEPPQTFRFELATGKVVPLRMKYQQNHMWRLQFTTDVPEVARGLRPILDDGSLGRSEYVAVFERTTQTNLFKLRFLKLGSADFKRLEKQSKNFGSFGQTSARSYGWH